MNNQSVIENIRVLYKNGETDRLIEKTVWLFKTSLSFGYNIGQLYTRSHDLGIKPTEMGISIALALKQTDNSVLCKTDVIIKNKLLKTLSKEIETWEKVEAEN